MRDIIEIINQTEPGIEITLAVLRDGKELTIGVTLGAILTIAFSIVLTSSFNMPTMAWYYTPLGMIALILIGQVAVLGPSSGAARTEPAIATRSI
ncbi:MAG: hypothetical protein HOD87_01475 [Gammaproteobacteria bacterium]|nr:hypothetical protein [Gammaproteobacteria bacterium]